MFFHNVRNRPISTRRPLRVLIVDTAVAFGGTLVVARNLLKHLDRTVVSASLVSACSGDFVSETFPSDAHIRSIAPRVSYVALANWKGAIRRRFRIIRLRRGLELLAMAAGLALNVLYLARLIAIYRKLHLDLVHVNNYDMEPLWAARILRIPIVYHLHGFLSPSMDGSGRRNFRHVAAFISISDAVSQSAIRAGIDRARIHHIPNFVEDVPEDPPPPLPIAPAIGIFGRVTQWKGQKEFLYAAFKLFPAFPRLTAYIVGDASDSDPAYYAECRELALASPFSEQIRFTGLVCNVSSYYRRCTVVVHASIEPEPFGMVLIEAMSVGRPVVASKLGATSEIITEGIDGFLVDPSNSDDIAGRVADLLSNPALAVSIGRQGCRTVQKRYGPLLAINRFEQLYRQVARDGVHTHSGAG